MLIHSGWNFTDEAFAEDGARVRPIGKAMRGMVGVRVSIEVGDSLLKTSLLWNFDPGSQIRGRFSAAVF